MRATPRYPTYAGTCPRGRSSATGRRPRSQPRWAVVNGRYSAVLGLYAKRARSKSDGGYDRAKHRMCGFNPSGLASGLTVHASGLASGLASSDGPCVGSGVGSDGPCVGSGVESDGPCVGSDVGSGVGSGVGSHTEPRTEPQKNHVGSSRAREPRQTCPDCGRSWPAEFGPDCHQCGDQPQTRSTTPDTTPSCYRRVRNCPQCHTLERGHNDTCQHCDWTRAAWDARGAT